MPAPVSLRLNDAPRYEEFYGFVHSPFTPSSDPRFLYRSRSHGAALDVLLDAARRRQPFALLIGDAGAGKTIVCRALEADSDAATVAACLLEPPRSAEDLLRTALVEFGVISPAAARSARVAEATRGDLERTLREFLLSLRAIEARCVLIVDDAHRLPTDLLHEIGKLSSAAGEPPLLTIVLAGEPSLAATLADAAMRPLDERIAARAALAALTREETGAYITHRLAAGAAPEPPQFDTAAADAIHARTAGVPRLVNVLCERTLTLAAQLGVRRIGPEIVEESVRTTGEAPEPAPTAGWWTRVPRWIWIVVPILVLLAVMAVWFSGAA